MNATTRAFTSTITGPGLEDNASTGIAQRSHGPRETRNIEDPSKPITYAQLAEILGGGPTPSGKTVTAQSAMKVSTVFACVRVIANAIARMPLITYRRTKEGRERATDLPLYQLLKLRPHPWMSSFTFRNTLMVNPLLHGNGYAEIVRRGDGRIQSLFPIESPRVTPVIRNEQLVYDVQTDRGIQTLLPRDIIHVPGLSFNGLTGLSVVQHARVTIGAAMAADDYSASLLHHGLKPSGVVTHPGRLSSDGAKNLRESINATYGGYANAGKPFILEEGATYSPLSMPLEDAQFVESSYFRVEDICRWFGVQPHKVQHLLRATNNNIEEQGLDFLGEAVAPWVQALEEELNYKLFLPEEQATLYCEHKTQAIIQMNADARGAYYERLVRIGVQNQDELRELENLNHIPDGRGSNFWIQSSHMPLPTPQQRDQLIDSWIKKGAGAAPGGANGPGDGGGQPNPKTDGQVAR